MRPAAFGRAGLVRFDDMLAVVRVCLSATLAAWLSMGAVAHAQEAEPDATFEEALVLDLAVGYVPVANDVPLILGGAIRAGGIHEVFARGGYMPTGDDVSYGFVVLGYRVALLPHELLRPVLGVYAALVPATCTHDDAGNPICDPTPLGIFAAQGGVRIEPLPWLGLFALISIGVDTYPNPFGMVELGASFALPLS